MTVTTIKVKNGVMKLPKALQKAWGNARISVRVYKDKAVLEGPIPQAQKRKYNLALWQKAAGILKNKKLPDAVQWQREIRKEWERKIV
ncbi:MAG TPA: hypothetical protein VGA53_04295 [Candidatus Paceibacterota bacterium]